MKKVSTILTSLLIMVAITPSAFAESMGSSGSAMDFRALVALAAGLAVGMGTFGAALGQGKTAASALEGIARNPSAADKIQTPMIIGLVLIESLAIYSLVVAILLWTKI